MEHYGACEFRVEYVSAPYVHARSFVREIAGCAYVQTDVNYRDYDYLQFAGGTYTVKTKYCSAQTSSHWCEVPGWGGEVNLTAKVRACGTYTNPWYVCGSTGWYYP